MNDSSRTGDVPEPVLRRVRVSLLRTLSARFPGMPETVEVGRPIQVQTDLDTLLRWYEVVAVADSLEDIRAALVPTGEGPTRSQPPPGDSPWLDRTFFENQKKVRSDLVRGFTGQYIAWSWDGASIVASDPDEATLYRKLQDAGIDVQRVVIDYAGDVSVESLL
jgi:hypothetical protein